MDPRTRRADVKPSTWLTISAFVALLILLLFGWCVRADAPATDPTPAPVATWTETPVPVVVLTSPPTATSLPLVRILDTPVPTATETPAPTMTPTVRPSMVQRGAIDPERRPT
jgi:hypothetical protein